MDEVVTKIAQLTRNQKLDRSLVGEVHEFAPVLVETGENLVRRAAAGIREECRGNPSLILVDLTYGSHLSETDVEAGRGLARTCLANCIQFL